MDIERAMGTQLRIEYDSAAQPPSPPGRKGPANLKVIRRSCEIRLRSVSQRAQQAKGTTQESKSHLGRHCPGRQKGSIGGEPTHLEPIKPAI